MRHKGQQGTSALRQIAGVVLALALALAAVMAPGLPAAQEAPAEAPGAPAPLTVGVFVSPPFVIAEGDAYTGMAIDLWQALAEGVDIDYRYRAYPTVGQLIDAVAASEVDIAVTNLTITRTRAQRIDFTQPWFDSGMRVLVDHDRHTGFGAVWSGLGDAGFLRAYAWIGIVILVATIGFTLFDRRFDPAFPPRWRDGFAESFFTVMSYATSGKATTRKNLFGWLGRIWQGLWLVFGLAVVAYVTSSVASVMTTLSIANQINSVADLSGKTVGVLSGSIGEEFAIGENLTVRAYNSTADMVRGLARNEIAAAIDDAPVLEYYVYTHPDEALDVVGPLFHPDKYGFGLPHGAELRRALNVQILGEKESGLISEIHERYFGDDPT